MTARALDGNPMLWGMLIMVVAVLDVPVAAARRGCATSFLSGNDIPSGYDMRWNMFRNFCQAGGYAFYVCRAASAPRPW